MAFESRFEKLADVVLPAYSGLRIMMMPVLIGDTQSIPDSLRIWRSTISRLWTLSSERRESGCHIGKVCYLTIDESVISPGSSHRRSGLHVDGIYHGGAGKWGGGGGGWASKSTGAITVSSHVGCRAWQQSFDGYPGPEGECDHLAAQCRKECEVYFEPQTAYWFDGLCVHESIPQPESISRQFMRLSLPSDAPWFDGYTENPLGVKPSGEILSRREFMDA